MKHFCLAVLLSLSILNTGFAHPVLPEPVMDFIWENPKATDAEIDAWLQQYPEYDVLDTREMMTMLRDLSDEELQNLSATPQVGEPTKPPSIGTQLLTFIRQGVIHILEGPDHVLFVLALLLLPIAMRQLLLVITTFTIAHSITLLLAGLELVQVASTIVEPIIALSIIYMALSSVFLPTHHFANAMHNKLAVVAGFGLFHGLGFASVFNDLHISSSNFILPLLGFNIGVELGQLCIIGLAVPVLNQIRTLQSSTLVIRAAAVLMSMVALWWFLQRIL